MFEVLQFTCTKCIETHLKHKCTFSSAHKHSDKEKKKKNFKSIYFYFSFAVAIQLLSHVQLFATTWTAACQTSLFFTVFRSLFKLMSIESIMPSSDLILCCSSPPASNPSQHQGLFQWVGLFASGSQNIGASAQRHSFQWIFRVETDCFELLGVQGTQESSPAPQLENINYSALSLFYGPTLTFVHDYWKNHSLASTDLFPQSDVSAF